MPTVIFIPWALRTYPRCSRFCQFTPFNKVASSMIKTRALRGTTGLMISVYTFERESFSDCKVRGVNGNEYRIKNTDLQSRTGIRVSARFPTPNRPERRDGKNRTGAA